MLYTPYNADFETKDIVIAKYNITRQNEIQCIQEKKDVMYGNIVKKDNIIFFFYRPYHGFSKSQHNGIIRLMKSTDGINFINEQDPVIYNMGSIPNNINITFYNNTFIGIGGRHCEKIIQEEHNKINCVCKNTNYDLAYKPKYNIVQSMFYNNGRGTLPFIKSTFKHKCYMNGLYLISSKNAQTWKLEKNIPIISGMDEGMVDKVFGATTFDSQGSLLLNEKTGQFFFYCRENTNKNVRAIQYSTSYDCRNWDKWKSINEPLFNYTSDNYYNSNFFKYPDGDFFIGFLPYYNNKFTSIMFLTSHNGIDWKRQNQLLKKSTASNSIYSYCPAHNSIILSNDKKEFYIYICTQKNSNSPSIWYRYSIRKDGFASFKNVKQNIGILKLKKNIKINNNLILNYKTSSIGYIIIQIYNTNNKNIHTSEKITGDSTNYSYNIPQNIVDNDVKLEFIIFEAEIFSFKNL